MDSQPRFQQLLSDIGLNQMMGDCIINMGYKTASDFAFSLPDPDALEALITLVLRDGQYPDGGVLQSPDMTNAALKIHPDAGRLRRLHQECKILTSPEAPATSSALAVPAARLDYEGALPPKLSEEAKTAMKKAWRESYPGNILDDNNCPGPRYWASVHHMFKAGNAKRHDPWTKITSKTEEDLMLSKRAARTPRSEIQTLLDACFDENHELPEHDITGNHWKVHNILEKRRVAFSLCGWPI